MTTERVAVLRCPATAPDAAIQAAVFRAAELVGESVRRGLSGKTHIFIKANMGTNDMRLHMGRQIALSDVSVVRATVALIREFHHGELLIGDATTGYSAYDLWNELGYADALAPYDVRPVDLKDGPFMDVAVPGGGVLHTHYWLAREYAESDAVVSCAKLKAHVSAGSTGTLKNLFGTLPTLHYGSPRRYLHAPVRLPRAVVDCGLLKPPVLCVIDGLVGQLGREWHGTPIQMDTLILGTDTVATDATAMRVQGMDPTADYGTWPFHWDSNLLNIAHRAGLGTNDPAEIAVVGDGIAAVHQQYTMDRPYSVEWDRVRREVAQQATLFAETRSRWLDYYAGKIIALSGGAVVDSDDTMATIGARIDVLAAGGHRGGIFLKRVVPEEAEREHLGIYPPIANGAPFTTA